MRIERERRHESRLVVEQTREFLVGGLRVVAQSLHRMRRRRPRAVQVATRLVENDGPATADRHAIAARRHSDGACRDVRRACLREHRLELGAADLHDRAELFGEQRGQRRARGCLQRDVEPAARGERHLDERREQAAVGAVVIGEDQRTKGLY